MKLSAALLLALLAAAPAARAQSAPVGTRPAETQPLTPPAAPPRALRTAKALAAVVLAGQVEGLSLGGGRTVAGLLAGSERARWMLLLALRDVDPAEPPEQSPDGACRVTVRVTLAELAGMLAQIHPGEPGRFASLAAPGGQRELSVSVAARADPALDGSSDSDGGAAEAFWAAHVSPDGAAAAEEAARRHAMAALTERIKAVRVDETATVAEFVTAKQPDADFEQFLRGARVTAVRRHRAAPIVEVEVELTLRTLYACLKSWAHTHRPDDADVGKLRRLIVAARGAKVRQVGLGTVDPRHLLGDDPRLLRSIALVGKAPDWAGQSLTEIVEVPEEPAPEGAHVADEEAIRLAAWRARAALAERMSRLPVSDQATIADTLGADPAGRAALLAAMRFEETVDPVGAPRHVTEVTVELPLIGVYRLLLARQLAETPTTVPITEP
ncbi:MAG TPA: hypothetical protein VFJ30_07320 [Phycisphaerae bacterium]|nr:hypothetical protein [Phycisphaerae bacterium]